MDLWHLFSLEGQASPRDKARSLVAGVTKGLVDIAVEKANELGQKEIGITGGVSYNQVVTSLVKTTAKAKGIEVLVPNELPNGDGCISTGQCAIALRKTARF